MAFEKFTASCDVQPEDSIEVSLQKDGKFYFELSSLGGNVVMSRDDARDLAIRIIKETSPVYESTADDRLCLHGLKIGDGSKP